jgi:7-keto-8-aminopelargonate synthetase-like enzyme
MSSLLQEVESRLEELRLQDQYRQLTVASGLDFSSNDYLGLSQDPAFRAAILDRVSRCSPLTSPSSRLLAGNTHFHLELEQRLSRLKGSEAALLFPSGYQANVGLLSTLIKPGDRVLSDRQNHASIIDGLRLSRCQKVIFPHLDTEAISEALSTPHPKGRTFLVTESLFSMDGDIAPLDVYARMAKQWGAHLIVDDSHALGVFGKERGSGLTEHFGIEGSSAAIVSTFGKALGLYGYK